MNTVLDQTSALVELAQLWEGDAKSQTRYDPDDPRAKVLARCASDLKRILGDVSPEWIPVRIVQATTGQSPSSIRRRCEELASEGRARKVGNRWEIRLDAALEIPIRDGSRREVPAGGDPRTVARAIVRGAA